MRVLWITPGFAAHEADHNCIPPLQFLAAELATQGIDVGVIALDYPYRHTPYSWHGHRVYPCGGCNQRLRRPLTYLRARAGAKALAPFDAIHSFWLGPAWYIGRYLARTWGVPQITTLMGQDVLPGNRRWLRRLPGTRDGQWVALSPLQATLFQQQVHLSTIQIPWGLSGLDIPATVPQDRPIDIIGVGSLIPVKNYLRWLEVVQAVHAQMPSLRAVLIGDGPQRPALEAAVRAKGLQNTVVFTGARPRAEVLVHMRMSKVLLHAADYESFGYVFAEAAANGCRIASTPVGIAAAFCSPTPDPAVLAQQVVSALHNKPPYVPFAPFTMAQCGAAYRDLYFGA
jgi:glycosyltransferase involved in cell wall biosynthesis